MSKSQPDVREVVALTTRLVATTSIAYQWCTVKTRQFLTSFSVSNFLLVSQTDLKVGTETSQINAPHEPRHEKTCFLGGFLTRSDTN